MTVQHSHILQHILTKNIGNKMIKLNGYWYSHEEVKEALQKKGYTVITLEISTEPRDFPQYETYAIKNGEQPYCKLVILPKMEKLEKLFKSKLKN